ncbi:amidohydrolase family protein [Micromonospora sp. WMMD812]|uniref:amidohydrolase family protein n=1 Tax=Micromonospora sp. WMMD812 TaxID=3015152 RepID=UPI00248A9591|nr:amidohydrolase family protein [Micromonospora sp. WMMD812]WBB67925.1 amidohydrolase family protein [Micromonospora sp. WMMD812]
MIVDAHHHLWRIEDGYRWLDAPELAPIRRSFVPDDLRPELTAAGVDRTVLVEGGRCDVAEAALLLEYARSTPAIAGVVAWVDPADPALADTIADYRRLPGGDLMVGVRPQLQAETDPHYLDREPVRRGLRAIAEAGLALDVVVRVDQLSAVARAAREVPELRFVLDHLGKPRIRDGLGGLAEWSGPVGALATLPNVTAKLSGLVTEASWDAWQVADLRPFVAEAVTRFGPDRLMFGSDWPVCRLAADYQAVLSALVEALPPLSAEERAAVFGDTAARTYQLRR